ncbi:hypothetical protein M0R04_10665 [Candidatus Dojkabacteria bacterium]|jgi:hypothetical protein|nr:hypothetical protein [Candidatus Dojkabacteria bacterium]
MAKRFICDKCSKEFPQAIEEEKIKDIHGVWKVYDLCAPCKNSLEEKKEKARKDFVK